MIFEKCKKILVKPSFSLKAALKQIDKSALQVLVVVNEEDRILGIVTDGDMRRAIIKDLDFKTPMQEIMTKNPIVISYKSNKEEALQLMKKYEIRHIPVVDEENKIIDIFLWKDFLKNGEVACVIKSIPVIIMAGGKGKRLDPFTKILPKPLIPIDEKPVIEVILVTYMNDLIELYNLTKINIELFVKRLVKRNYKNCIFLWSRRNCQGDNKSN